jgi:hypothetical protein
VDRDKNPFSLEVTVSVRERKGCVVTRGKGLGVDWVVGFDSRN